MVVTALPASATAGLPVVGIRVSGRCPSSRTGLSLRITVEDTRSTRMRCEATAR
jgi:hypothetical protein